MRKDVEQIRQNMISLGKDQVNELSRFVKDAGEPEGMVPRMLTLYEYKEVINHAIEVFKFNMDNYSSKSIRQGDDYNVINHFSSSNPEMSNVFLRREFGNNGDTYEYMILVVNKGFLSEFKKDWNIG